MSSAAIWMRKEAKGLIAINCRAEVVTPDQWPGPGRVGMPALRYPLGGRAGASVSGSARTFPWNRLDYPVSLRPSSGRTVFLNSHVTLIPIGVVARFCSVSHRLRATSCYSVCRTASLDTKRALHVRRFVSRVSFLTLIFIHRKNDRSNGMKWTTNRK